MIKYFGIAVSLRSSCKAIPRLIADMIHSVESEHRGSGPSSVLYIPAVPLTPKTIEYVRDQRSFFQAGLPAPDFPGGVGESQHADRGVERDILTPEGRSA